MSIVISDKVSPAAKKDIRELENKISRFKDGKIDEENFKLYRLTRGVYGQRQLGVQMYRTKLPYGKITPAQLVRLGEISNQYTNGNLHLTTRQNIQLHYIKLDDTPEILDQLEEVGVTSREACGNTVRNITASPIAGIDPDEPFDVSPYAEAVFQHFLRNPICQEMGRKVKMAFSSSHKDSALTFLHDFGFIPKLKDGQRGFRVVVGGGLGAQAIVAQEAFDFLPADELIPFVEAGLRIFDRYGEREKRFKARMKFLMQDKNMGLQGFMEQVAQERKALPYEQVKITPDTFPLPTPASPKKVPDVAVDQQAFERWKSTNVIPQKQERYYAVLIKIPLGNISAATAFKLAELAEGYACDDMRITVDQNLLFKFVRESSLKYLYAQLQLLDLADDGAEKVADVTACPGTDTCNLGVTNSTGVSLEIEKMIREEFPQLITEDFLKIKISGCMNSCGQHMIANIGLHGSSIKNGKRVVPALQLVLGGGVDGEGNHTIADKVIKLPGKRILEAFRLLFNDFESKALEGEYFNDYYVRHGKMYFYTLLKPLADIKTIQEHEYVDWGHNEDFVPEIGVGECAGASLDVVGSIIIDAEEKLHYAREALDGGHFADAVYNSYNTMVVGAKALLLSDDVACNTQMGIIRDFDKHFITSGKIKSEYSFEELVLQMKKHKPDEAFAKKYFYEAASFIKLIKNYREQQNEEDKLVVADFYKA